MKKRDYTYRLFQDGIQVARVDCADKKRAQQEILHYAMIYGQDGPVDIKPRIRRPSRKERGE